MYVLYCKNCFPLQPKTDSTGKYSSLLWFQFELARAGCGSDNICQSYLQLTVSASDNIVTGSDAELAIDVTVVNNGEPSYNTEVMFTFHSNMTYSTYVNTPSNMLSSVSCSPVNGSVKCSTEKQMFLRGETIKFRLTLDARRVVPEIDSFVLKVEVKTGSKDVNVNNNVYTKSIGVLTKVAATFYMYVYTAVHTILVLQWTIVQTYRYWIFILYIFVSDPFSTSLSW